MSKESKSWQNQKDWQCGRQRSGLCLALGLVLALADNVQANLDSMKLPVLRNSCFHSQIWKPNVNLLSKLYTNLTLMAFISEGGQKSLLL